jgi:pyruvate dehydrogenase E1 component beta subunit
VVTPSTVEDAYWLLRSAIASHDPVVFFEPKRLYWSKAQVNLPVTAGPIGTAAVRREGKDATLIAYGQSVPVALEAAQHGAELGYDLEVVDLRSLVPFDDATVAASVERTSRAIVVHEAAGFAGFGAEIAARVCERCFYSLEAPVLRVTGLDLALPPAETRTLVPAICRPHPRRCRTRHGRLTSGVLGTDPRPDRNVPAPPSSQ